uniref:Uncharacterized protein n=1 Tax=Glossina austeni TaxID=7395 RepID=A0A1A9UWE7_GLOAU
MFRFYDFTFYALLLMYHFMSAKFISLLKTFSAYITTIVRGKKSTSSDSSTIKVSSNDDVKSISSSHTSSCSSSSSLSTTTGAINLLSCLCERWHVFLWAVVSKSYIPTISHLSPTSFLKLEVGFIKEIKERNSRENTM